MKSVEQQDTLVVVGLDDIKYDTPYEVNERQYKALWKDWSWIVAFRVEDGKYFIKLWRLKYKEHVLNVLRLNA